MPHRIDYKQLYDDSPDLCFAVEPVDGTIIECNATLLEALGFGREQIIGRPVLQMYHPACRDQAHENMAAFRRTGQLVHKRLQVLRADGSAVDVSLRFTAIRDAEGTILYSDAVWRDITELMNIERLLAERTREAEAAAHHYEVLYQDAPDMHLSVSPDGTVIKCNDTMVRRLGYAREEIVGQPLLNLYHPDDHDLARDNIRSFVETGRVEHRELVALKKDGGTLHVSLDFTSVRDENGVLLHSNAVWRDITEIVRAREALTREKARSEQLLLNVLPAPIARRLRNEPGPIADAFEDVSVLFADVVGFTPLSSKLDARTTVVMLNEVFTAFDAVCTRHGVEKVRTIGDGYMVIAGAPEARADHAEVLGRVALEIAEIMRDRDDGLQIRIGLNSGPAVAGIVGTTKFHYDVWGDAVNVAARMESTGRAGMIQIAKGAWTKLRHRFACEERGTVEVKGKGLMSTWWLTAEHAGLTV